MEELEAAGATGEKMEPVEQVAPMVPPPAAEGAREAPAAPEEILARLEAEGMMGALGLAETMAQEPPPVARSSVVFG